MFKGRQFDQSVILLCVRWYLASHGQFKVKGLNSATHEQNSRIVSASKV
jgi:transposase-like protein